jgi:aspartate aminotransferase-like enzyme
MVDPQAATLTQLRNIQAKVGKPLAEPGTGAPAAALPPAHEGDPLDGIHTGAKAHLRTLHEAMIQRIEAFADFERAPKKGYDSLRRKKQFAMLGPATKDLLELGLDAKGLPEHPRLKAQPPGGMCSYTVRFGSTSEIDARLLGWVRGVRRRRLISCRASVFRFQEPCMPGLRPDVDPDGLLEYSVVYTDRALNHMSARFQRVMQDVSATLKQVYGATSAIVVPGSGTFGMEAVARQFGGGKRALVVRNGWFSYRWSQIFEMSGIAGEVTVLKARTTGPGPKAPFAPAPISEVTEAIRRTKPDLVFAPHVETSAGMLLPDDYLRAVADAVHAHGGLFVLDCVASGAVWVDMRATGVDVLISAPQKGWSSTPCAGLVMLGERARAALEGSTSSSFSMDLKKWLAIMETHEKGGMAYHATLPTDGLVHLQGAMAETAALGFERAKAAQFELGRRVRALLEAKGIASVAAAGFQAPGVVVSYTDHADWQNTKAWAAQGLQIAAGVPLACDEGPDFRSFRIGLFGLDKLKDVDGAVARFERALDALT